MAKELWCMPEMIESPALTLADYQTLARTTAIFPEIGGHKEIYPILGLVNESGEVAGKLKKIFRDHDGNYQAKDLQAISAELGDVLWYLAAVADSLGLNLEMIAQDNLAKLASRQRRNALQGSGDDR